jgi:hypothetical protein
MNIFLVIVCIIVCVGLYVINESVQGGIQRNIDVTDKIDELIKLIQSNRAGASYAEEQVRQYLSLINKNLDNIKYDMESISKEVDFDKLDRMISKAVTDIKKGIRDGVYNDRPD